MIYVSVSYNYTPGFNSPESWFKRTEGYNGMLESLSKTDTVISLTQIDYEGNCAHNGVQYRFVNFGRNKTYFPRRLNNYVKNLNADVVIIQGLHHPLQVIQLGLLLNKKTKVIAQHHAEKPFTGIKKYVQRMADRFVDAYLFASKSIGMDWVKNGNLASAQKIHEVMEVSSNFYSLKKAPAKLKTGVEGQPVFLWVGRLNANKDPLNVVSGFLKFAAAIPGARLYMIYHTDELLGQIRQVLDRHTSKNTVKLIGQVPHNDLLYWFNSADFFVSGSHYEGSGTALCEAMSCGCIPVVTDIFSFRMITDDGNCGILYQAGNEQALVSALNQTKHTDVVEKRKRSLTYFKENLSFDAIAIKIRQIVDGL